ncbi:MULTISPECIES: hypothetical protein [Actinokineospora]|uniref:Uncharacterized protein n=1 Tax=Actinokineospora fastidiosa TaxID=1816 RepID=A0A918GL23_9PSEU|nr:MULTISPECIES: hypothetical protein [Actinokineospora]UVS77581.1 hypothetical protein Actkin_01296 [Actinokineospora sp. UTMC 2448]GGS42392.1 hypothetical protein GCM10010171_41550 [Actinokineospora fastidiosa]
MLKAVRTQKKAAAVALASALAAALPLGGVIYAFRDGLPETPVGAVAVGLLGVAALAPCTAAFVAGVLDFEQALVQEEAAWDKLALAAERAGDDAWTQYARACQARTEVMRRRLGKLTWLLRVLNDFLKACLACARTPARPAVGPDAV